MAVDHVDHVMVAAGMRQSQESLQPWLGWRCYSKAADLLRLLIADTIQTQTLGSTTGSEQEVEVTPSVQR